MQNHSSLRKNLLYLLSTKYLDFYSDVIWFLQDSVKNVEIYVQMIFQLEITVGTGRKSADWWIELKRMGG